MFSQELEEMSGWVNYLSNSLGLMSCSLNSEGKLKIFLEPTPEKGVDEVQLFWENVFTRLLTEKKLVIVGAQIDFEKNVPWSWKNLWRGFLSPEVVRSRATYELRDINIFMSRIRRGVVRLRVPENIARELINLNPGTDYVRIIRVETSTQYNHEVSTWAINFNHLTLSERSL